MPRKKEDSPRPNNSELKILELLWEQERPLPAREVTRLALQRYGWNKNTTYTLLGSLAEKGYLRREEPGFLCVPLADRRQVQLAEARSLVDRLFDGSPELLLSAFCEEEAISSQELERLQKMVDQYARSAQPPKEEP